MTPTRWLAWRLVATLVAWLALVANAAAQENAATEYDRLAALLDGDAESPMRRMDFDEEAYLRDGVADPSMQAWLDRTRPLVPELLRATDCRICARSTAARGSRSCCRISRNTAPWRARSDSSWSMRDGMILGVSRPCSARRRGSANARPRTAR